MATLCSTAQVCSTTPTRNVLEAPPEFGTPHYMYAMQSIVSTIMGFNYITLSHTTCLEHATNY